MNENMMKRLGDPKYDEDLVNLGYLNKLLNKQPYTKTVDKYGWTKIDFGSYQEYYKNGQYNYTYSGNTWGWISFTENNNRLPDGIIFNSANMSFIGIATCNDAAIIQSMVANEGTNVFKVSWNNKYSGQVGPVRTLYHCVLKVYK